MSAPADQMPYADARAELEQVVARLEREELPLEAALDLWERGEDLIAACRSYLDGARDRVSARVAARRASGDNSR